MLLWDFTLITFVVVVVFFFHVSQVQTEMRDRKIGLGMNFGSIGSKAQRITKRFHDVSTAEQNEARKKLRT